MRVPALSARAFFAAAAIVGLSACLETLQHGEPVLPPGETPPEQDEPVPSNLWPPDERSTGWEHTGVQLTPYAGPSRITVPGTVIDGAHISSCLDIAADQVTIRRSRLDPSDCSIAVINIVDKSGTDQGGHRGILLEDLEIDGKNDPATRCAVAGGGYTARRLHVHGINCGFSFAWNDGIVVESSFVHDLVGVSAKDALSLGNAHVVLRDNNLEDPTIDSSAIFLTGDRALIDDFLIEHNLLNGGGYVLEAGSHASKPFPVATNVRVISNRWGRKFNEKGGYWGPVSGFDPSGQGNVWSDNAWLDTGEPILP